MSKTNCINCGAAKDTNEIKCPFCGTTYVDLTAIDFSSGDPVVCQFVLPNNVKIGDSNAKVVMSMLAIPCLEDVSMTSNTTDIYGWGRDTPVASFVNSYDINVGVSFKPIQRKDKSVITFTAAETGGK